MKKFEFLSHTADIKFRAFGKTLEEVFENSAFAFSSILNKEKLIKKTKKRIFIVKGNDLEALMFRFLEEILFLFETEGFLLSEIKVRFGKDKKSLKAEAYGGEKLDKRVRHYVKAVTYNDMFVKNLGKKGWISQVVIDV